MLLGRASGWARPQESGKLVDLQTELRFLDFMLGVLESQKPTTILVELRRLPGVRSMNIDHHENVCRSARTCTSTRPASGAGERKHSLNIFSLNRANRELETENKRTTATSTQKFRRNIWDLSFFSLRHSAATFSALFEPVFGFFCRSPRTFLQKCQKRSDFGVTSRQENCSRLISFSSVTPTDIFVSFLRSKMLISALDCSYTKKCFCNALCARCYRPQIEFSLKLNGRLLAWESPKRQKPITKVTAGWLVWCALIYVWNVARQPIHELRLC